MVSTHVEQVTAGLSAHAYFKICVQSDQLLPCTRLHHWWIDFAAVDFRVQTDQLIHTLGDLDTQRYSTSSAILLPLTSDCVPWRH